MSTERLQRRLGLVEAPTRAVKSILLFAIVGAFALGIAFYGRNPDLSHVKVAFLSGTERGNYYAVVQKMAGEAKRHRGRIDNIATAGSVENIAKLAAGKASCNVHFALVQDGSPWPPDYAFELIGRLPRSESLVLVSRRNGDQIESVQDLRGKRIGVGPAGSGTEYVMRVLMAQLTGLDITVSTHSLVEQLAELESGDLDLAAMVIDADAQLLVEAVRDRNLQIIDTPGAEALANRLPFARVGRIEAGHYDPIRQLPSTDKRVIQIDTLVIGNGCARESATQGIITTLANVFPDYVRVNRERANLTGLQMASGARSYNNGGPDPVGAYVPWIIDIMPTARWLQLAFAISVLFATQAALHRFRLWRIDAQRVHLEGEVSRLFEPGVTVAEIAEMAPEEGRHRDPAMAGRIDGLTAELGALAQRCRRQSLSIIVPMGQEMSYRYQEALIADLVHALKTFRRRLDV